MMLLTPCLISLSLAPADATISLPQASDTVHAATPLPPRVSF